MNRLIFTISEDALAPIDLSPLPGTSGRFGIEVTRKRVGTFVVVMIDIIESAEVNRQWCSFYEGHGRQEQSIPNTRNAFVRRNFGQTWSLNPTSESSVTIRSSDRPIGK